MAEPGQREAARRAASRWAWLAAVAVVVLGLLLRVLGSDSGLPFTYDPDEPDFVDRAFRMLETGDMNPRWFGHPGSVTIYSFWMVFAGYASGFRGSMADLSAAFRSDPSVFYWLARAVTVVFGAATVALTYLFARRVVGPWLAVFAAGLLALAPQHIEFSRVARPDAQLTFLVLAAGWCALSIAARGHWRDYLAAGLLLGLGVATKYPALIFALVIVFAHGLRLAQAGAPPWRDPGRVVGAAAATLAGAFAGAPWLFLSLPAALGDIAREARSYHLGATSSGFTDSLWWYLREPLLAEIGVAGLALAVLGAVAVLRRRDHGGVLALAAVVAFMIFISMLSLRWPRWVLPAVPFLCVLAAVGLGEVLTAVSRLVPARPARGVASVLALLAVAGPAAVSLAWTQAVVRGDTRDEAWRWIIDNVPAGSAILGEAYTPQLPPDRYRLYEVSEARIWRLESSGRRYAVPRGIIGTLSDASAVRRAGIDYVVIASHYDRRQEEPARYQREIGVYEELMRGGELVFEAEPAPSRAVGLHVRVYRVAR